MELATLILILAAAFLILGIAAAEWGDDTRDGFPTDPGPRIRARGTDPDSLDGPRRHHRSGRQTLTDHYPAMSSPLLNGIDGIMPRG